MWSAVYDSAGIRLLSVAHAAAIADIETSLGEPLTEAEKRALSPVIIENLMDAYDGGERDSGALKRAALQGRTPAAKETGYSGRIGRLLKRHPSH